MTYPFSFSSISICLEKLAIFGLLENNNKNYVLIHKLRLTLIGVSDEVVLVNLIESLMMSSKLATQDFLEIIIF